MIILKVIQQMGNNCKCWLQDVVNRTIKCWRVWVIFYSYSFKIMCISISRISFFTIFIACGISNLMSKAIRIRCKFIILHEFCRSESETSDEVSTSKEESYRSKYERQNNPNDNKICVFVDFVELWLITSQHLGDSIDEVDG